MQAVLPKKSSFGAVIDAVFDRNAASFWLQRLNPIWSLNQSLAKVVKKQQEAADTVSLTLKTNARFIAGQAGQHHPVIVTINGRRYERTYSLTQIDPQHVLLTVKQVAHGIVSTWLVEQAKEGDIVELGAPYGDMLTPKPQQALVLLAAGSGITPMYSLVLETLKQHTDAQVHLMYWVKTPADVVFQTQFEQLQKQHANFKVELFYTQGVVADQRLNENDVARIAELQHSTVYACGPSGFVHTAEQLFQGAQLFKSEAFSLSEIKSDDVGFVNITLTKSNKTVSIAKGQSVLAGLEQQNIQPAHGCRMGICNKCACHKVQGSTKNLVNGMENAEPGHLLKICVNSAQTDLTIDL